MGIELRRVETDADADVFLGLRNEIDPEHMMARAAYLEHYRSPTRLDLLGLLDGEPVGAGFVEPHGDDLAGEGPEAWISVRVLRRHRRHGVGTELFRALSVRARADGRTALTMSARHDDLDAQAYLGKRGFVEVLRMRDSDPRSRPTWPSGSSHPRVSSSSRSRPSSNGRSTRRRS